MYSAQTDPEADWVALQLPSATGEAAQPQTETSVDAYVVVSAKCEHPEAVVRMLNYFVEEFNNEYDKCLVSYDGETTQFPLMYIMLRNSYALQNLNAHYEVVDAVEKNDPSALRSEYKVYYDSIMKYKEGDIVQGYQGEKVFGSDMSSYTVIDYYHQNDLPHLNQFFGTPTQTMSEKLSLVKDAVMQYYTKVIMGSESVDGFDDFVAECNTLGLDKMTEEVNQWHQER